MNKKTLIVGAASCLALLLAVCPADAQRGGRGGGRGGWGGGHAYYGGGHAYYGGGRGYYGGGRYYGGRGYYGGYGGFYGLGLGLGYPYWNGGGYYYSPDNYYYSPEYYTYGTPGVIYDSGPAYYEDYTTPGAAVTQPLAGPVMTSDPTGLPPNGTVAQANGSAGRQSFYSGPTAPQAVVRVKTAGPGAFVWINGTPMGTSQSGEQVFTFHSPSPGSTYMFREAWTENGKQMSREKQVTLQPGQSIVMDFNKADAKQAQGNKNGQFNNTQSTGHQNGQPHDFSTKPPAQPLPKQPAQPSSSDTKPKSEL